LFQNFLTVAQQVVILFILIAIGFIAERVRLLTEPAVEVLTGLVLYLSVPAVIINSFQRSFDRSMLAGLGLAMLAALVIHAVLIALVSLIFRGTSSSDSRVQQFAVVFSNAGYMSLPLQRAILGADGVFFGAAYIAVFNLVTWSYGIWRMSGDTKAISAKRLLFNPGLIGIAGGLAVFLLSITLPPVISEPINYLAGLNTPLPMFIIGFYLSRTDLRAALRDRRSYGVAALRLLVMPALVIGGMLLCGIGGPLLIAFSIAVSAPTAAATTMFAARFGGDARLTELSVNLVSLTTLLAALTMPLMVMLAQSF